MSGRRGIQVDTVPKPGGAYSQAVVANGVMYSAGLGPHDANTGEVIGTDVAAQTHQVMRNLASLLASEGLDFTNVVKATVHLQHLDRDFAAFNSAYATHFTEPYPVRTTVGSSLAGILVEIDVIAVAA